MKESVLHFDECRRPIVVVNAASDDALSMKRSPTHEERNRYRHCTQTPNITMMMMMKLPILPCAEKLES